MDIRISFPGDLRVAADLGAHVIQTDQSPEHGGAGSAPEPFDLFLASLGTCAGAYVASFCRARGISTAGIALNQRNRFDAAMHKLESVELEIVLPPSFPEKYRSAVERAAASCKVKKLLASPPAITVVTRIEPTEPAERSAL
jgi:ribosomal protein S12 methylthiotransferase accessory factor